MADIQKILKENYIKFDLAATEKEAAINELAELFNDADILTNKDEYLRAVMRREEESTTGIGFGVAIPHGKSAGVKEASLAFARSQAGISWDSMDGQPVHLMFLIAVPESSNDEHLRILSQLARKLMHEEVREALMNADTATALYNIFDQ
ncbi:MAG: PTS sugar transporter subunit IIA [Streptococcaceae bacterium]|jgi:PTS system nitrogen regulatory IIA component|nr:PTS sugar transporter subunit IIA [Streptococcaceae bacterium]